VFRTLFRILFLTGLSLDQTRYTRPVESRSTLTRFDFWKLRTLQDVRIACYAEALY